MRANFYRSVCLWMLISTVKSEEYLTADDNEELQYITTEVFPRQISVLNSTSNVGVVIDSIGERLAILNGDTGEGVIIDKGAGIGIEIERGGWFLYEISLQEYLKDCNVSDLMEKNYDSVFQLEEQPESSQSTQLVHGLLYKLSLSFLTPILQAGNIFTGMLKYFGYIMHPIKNLLGPVLNMVSTTWMIFKGGFMGLLNIFNWMGKLISTITGGLPAVVKMAVQFSLSSILSAVNGVESFLLILKSLARVFNLMIVLKDVLLNPFKMVKYIVGLGGQMLRGLTGVFGIVSQLFSFSLSAISTAIKTLIGLIVRFLRGKPPPIEVVGESVDNLLAVSRKQTESYHNEQDFDEYNKFFKAVKGEGDYKIHGVSVGPIVKAITHRTNSAGAILVNALGCLKPIVPLNDTLPQLLVNLVTSLNTTDGQSYVEQIIPSIKIPKEGLQGGNQSLAGQVLTSSNAGESLDDRKNLPASQLLKQLPVVSQIYAEIDEAAKTYHNTSLDSLLQPHHENELVEFTTKALGLV